MTDKNKNRIFSRARTSVDSDIYLSGQLGPPEDYIEEFQTIRESKAGEEVHLYLNGPGGYLSTAIQFINTIQATEATVTCHIEGECHSALTIIFLAAQKWVVNSNALMLIHNYSGGAYGKGRDIVENVVANDQHANELYKSIYEGFLSDKEITQLLNSNKDLWLSTEGIVKRLEDVVTLRDLLQEQHTDKVRAEMEEQIRIYNESSTDSGDVQKCSEEV